MITSRRFNFATTRQHYRVLGHGRPLVLLHGALVNHPWGSFPEKLAQHFTVYLPDLPGFGTSPAIAGRRHNTDLFAQTLEAFLQATRLQTAPIVALSLGTIVAVKTAARQTHHGKLILVGAPGKLVGWQSRLANSLPTPIKTAILATAWGRQRLLLPLLKANIGGKQTTSDTQLLKDLQTTNPRSLAEINYQQDIEVDFRQALARLIRKPVFVYGQNDPLRSTTRDLKMQRLLVADAGHNIFTDNPTATLKLLEVVLAA